MGSMDGQPLNMWNDMRNHWPTRNGQLGRPLVEGRGDEAIPAAGGVHISMM
jgi:hypothetical protein